jgi:glycosyltransferase involved in cell wall biosynthesis
MIAIVYPQFYGVGGIARYLDSFLSNLPAGHPTVYLITGDLHRVPREYRGVEILHIPSSSSRLNLFTWGLKARKLLVRLHAEGKIQWINLHFPPLIPGLLLPRGIPMLLTAHTTYLGMSGRFYAARHFRSQWSALSLAIKYWMERRIFARTDRVITLTEQGRQEVLSYGFDGPIDVIPNGADVNLFTPGAGIEKSIDVLFCGRIELRKGSRAMAEVCRRLVAAKPNIKICIVGSGDDEAFVHDALAPLAANVELVGKVPFEQMLRYYDRSRVYASTSYYEGLPGTCLEAMAMRLPAVVWDFLFYRGLVVEGGTGLLAPPNDFAAMTAKILGLLADETAAQRMGANGRALLQRDYHWGKLARDIMSVFREPPPIQRRSSHSTSDTTTEITRHVTTGK